MEISKQTYQPLRCNIISKLPWPTIKKILKFSKPINRDKKNTKSTFHKLHIALSFLLIIVDIIKLLLWHLYDLKINQLLHSIDLLNQKEKYINHTIVIWRGIWVKCHIKDSLRNLALIRPSQSTPIPTKNQIPFQIFQVHLLLSFVKGSHKT